MTRDEALAELEREMGRLTAIIDQEIKHFAKMEQEFGTPHVDPWTLRYANGELILAPLLVARTNALAAWAILTETGNA